ncbi:uncharacterized protein TRIADDRAFT_49728 [Trichoplax adhaerens]|uniref:Methyltransferase domain-containing protein n=1 Tax=Trichoplax adhaerens TaxID=10228 RepID=B3RM83_TRIAD|nr:hypothetical protein TRIADDRAFT_49728 [Trichoplax adhaerens]EDV29653.1 hypothetical protein TRIADDRAFT_49728 [Trichoplax adhaerens]|eukprot:XP_002108855.1 hypothetical protein TRIADDRAFT_49728 [Trichoplax adhaerens]
MADLLPKTHQDFALTDYWDSFYKKRDQKSFEYYGEYSDHCVLLHKYCRKQDKILHVGCGNSRLSEDLYDAGFHDILNIDTSDVVIRQMTDRNHHKRPQLIFQKLDIKDTHFDDGYFNVILDKGTLDAMTADEHGLDQQSINAMFTEIHRITRVYGRYICISLCQERSLKAIVEWFNSSKQWMIRIHKVQTADMTTEKSQGLQLQVFALVLTKMMPPKENMPAIKPVLRIGEEFQIELWGKDSTSNPRYSLTLVDSPRANSKSGKFAVFIVPEGRETEWMFSTCAGRSQLAADAGFERLVVVHLQRGHQYKDMQTIQDELSAKVLELKPDGLSHKHQIPYLSVGDNLGNRTVICEGKSELSGEYIIEDVIVDNQKFRRLLFLSNKNVVQSEGLLRTVKKKKKKGKSNSSSTREEINHLYLACNHHAVIVSGLSLMEQLIDSLDTGFNVLLIGLGGGNLPMFMHKLLPQISVDCVDIDEAIVDVAVKWFNFKADDRLNAHVDDGLQFIDRYARGKRYAIVIFDVNSGDNTTGMSCPPKQFTTLDLLQNVANMLSKNGIFMLNLVCRDSDLRAEVIGNVKSAFKYLFSVKIEQQVNEIIFAMNSLENPIFIEKIKDKRKVSAHRRINGGIVYTRNFTRLTTITN